jgi:hypothetical protein
LALTASPQIIFGTQRDVIGESECAGLCSPIMIVLVQGRKPQFALGVLLNFSIPNERLAQERQDKGNCVLTVNAAHISR